MSPSSISWLNIAFVTSSSQLYTFAGPLRCNKWSATAPFLTTLPFGARLPFKIAIPPSSWTGLSKVWITSVFLFSTVSKFSLIVLPVTVNWLVSILSPNVFNTAWIPPAKCKSIIESSPAGEIRAIWGTFLEILSNNSKSTDKPLTSLARAGMWRAVLEDPPNAISTAIALLNDSWVKISDGLMSSSTSLTICLPDFNAIWLFSSVLAWVVAQVGRDKPNVSVIQAIVFAVNKPEQLPAPGQAHFSSSVTSSSDILPAEQAPTASNTVIKSAGLPLYSPETIGPPVTTIDGTSTLVAPIIIPGTTLSQLGINTSPSKACPLVILSTVAAMISLEGKEYFIPSWFILIPSQIAIVSNSNGIPPAAIIPSLTNSTSSFKWIWPGTMSVKLFAIPINGFLKSSSSRPQALKRDLCGALWIPFFTLSLFI